MTLTEPERESLPWLDRMETKRLILVAYRAEFCDAKAVHLAEPGHFT